MVDRPRTVAAATSFHFSYISIAKQAFPTVGGEPVEGAFGKVRNAALNHSKYIERDGAAEVSRGADHADYIGRPGAEEMLVPAALMSEGVERTISAIINETPTLIRGRKPPTECMRARVSARISTGTTSTWPRRIARTARG